MNLGAFATWSDCALNSNLHFINLKFLTVTLQGTKQQYYTGYTEDSLVTTMKHMAKNVVKVNEKLTKYTVSIATFWCFRNTFAAYCGSVGKGSVCYLKAYAILTSLWEDVALVPISKHFGQTVLLLLCKLVHF